MRKRVFFTLLALAVAAISVAAFLIVHDVLLYSSSAITDIPYSSADFQASSFTAIVHD